MMKKMKREKSHYIVKNKISLFYQLRDLLLTFTLWGLWGYIFYPLISLILWKYFDINIFYNKSEEEINAIGASLSTFVLSAGAMIFLLTLTFNGWGFYNKKRFQLRGNKRQLKPKAINSEMMAESLQIDPKSIDICKEAKYVQIFHTDKNPNPKTDLFKPTHDLNVKSINLYFSDNWDKIRETSNFSYTHIPLEEEEQRNR